MIISLIIRSLGFFLIAGAGYPPAIVLLMALFGLTSSMNYSASIFHGSSGSLNRSRRMAIHEAVLSAGVVCESLLGGLIYEYVSVTALYRFASLVTLAGGIAQMAFRRSGPAGEKWPQPAASPFTVKDLKT